jgi:hypothetical protein
MNLRPAEDCFGIDGFELVTHEPFRPEFLTSLGYVPPYGDWLDKTYRYMATRRINQGTLQAFWEPRKWLGYTYPQKIRFNPSRAGYNGWATWRFLQQTVFTWLGNARVKRMDTKLDFNNTMAEVLSSLYLKGAKSICISPKYPKTVYIGEMGGIQLVIYDKGWQLRRIPDELIRVEIRQSFKTNTSVKQHRPFMMEMMCGDLIDSHPFKHVLWIDPKSLPPRIRAVAKHRGINAALLDENIDVDTQTKTRRRILRNGSDDIYRLYLTGAELWHSDFVTGFAADLLTWNSDHTTDEDPYPGGTIKEILIRKTAIA